MKKYFFTYFLFFAVFIYAQQAKDSIAINRLNEVVVASSRIDLPLSENSRSIQIISAETIRLSGVTNVADLLQQVSGVDIRRRGVEGTQADLYIRGGSFDQTLLLIDGIKLEDVQTGHHTLNFVLPLEVIERIEILKGPAARVFGQNAFTGAINIVTKSALSTTAVLAARVGSFKQRNGEATFGTSNENSSLLAHYSIKSSDGYRYNTDFTNHNVFLKGQLNKSKRPIDIIASFSERKFGANGFYALPIHVDQYEETQASLIAFSTKIQKEKWVYKPRVYWRRGQDMYVFVRNNPALYRNLHITNKLGASLDASYFSSLGTTGLGVDLARVSIDSNNLGERERFITTLFAEHRFQFFRNRLDITPGLSVSNYTDFGTQFFPGVDIGFAINPSFRLFANAGYTYRIPTFTDLYYSDPTTLGNENLRAEEAITEEIGFRWTKNSSQISMAVFNRSARNLIDYIRPTTEGRFEASNIRKVNTQGFEFEVKTQFILGNNPQLFTLGYTYLNDDVDQINVDFSRYSINSLRHHLTFNQISNFNKNLSLTWNYKLGQRPERDAYHVFDASIRYKIKAVELDLSFFNIFDEVYSESNLVPLPLSNGTFGLRFAF